MPISRSQVQFGGKGYSKEKLKPGRYKCVVTEVRTNDTRSQGEGYFVDFEVAEALTPDASKPGAPGSYAVFPDNAKGSAKMPKAKAKQMEEGKFVIAVAACMGKSRDEVEFVTQARLDAAVVGMSDKSPKVSPLNGKFITVISVPYTNAKKEETSYYDIEPFLDGAASVEEETELPPAKKAPPKGGKKSAPKFPPEGWETATDADGDTYYYNDDESLYEDDLRARIAA